MKRDSAASCAIACSRLPTVVSAGVVLLTATLIGCAVPVTRTTEIYDAPEPRTYNSVEFGTVSRIEVVDTTQEPTGGGAVLGGLVGGVLGNQIGEGGGRAAATVLGAFGGALLGNNIEQGEAAANSRHYYRIAVQLDSGLLRTFQYYELNGLHVGARVKLDHGVLAWA